MDVNGKSWIFTSVFHGITIQNHHGWSINHQHMGCFPWQKKPSTTCLKPYNHGESKNHQRVQDFSQSHPRHPWSVFSENNPISYQRLNEKKDHPAVGKSPTFSEIPLFFLGWGPHNTCSRCMGIFIKVYGDFRRRGRPKEIRFGNAPIF